MTHKSNTNNPVDFPKLETEMNARIQQLALEAFDPINAMASEGVADRHTFDQAWFQLYNNKFAELIVQECIELCDKEHAHSIHTHAGPWNTAIKRCKESIATHFGVEE